MKSISRLSASLVLLLTSLLSVSLFAACSSDTVDDAIESIENEIDPPSRKDIDRSRLGINAFGNDAQFGSPSDQFLEARDTLGIKFIRMLFNWDDNLQASPGDALSFGFFDALASSIPDGVDAFVVLTGVPSWMADSAHWVEDNPRTTFVENFVKPVVNRYKGNGRIIGFQIWNEPNMLANPDNSVMQMTESPDNYVELLARAYGIVKDMAPSKMVLNAATTSINQNFPSSLNYNKGMRDAGAKEFTDVWAFHYYGKQFKKLVGDIERFLNGLDMELWVTESGQQGVNEQLAYGEQVWPFLRDNLPDLNRIYVYQFAEATSAENTFGLRNPSADLPVSDLYVHLRDGS